MLSQALAAIIQTLPGPVFARDLNGRYIVANDAAAALYGLPSVDGLIGKTDADMRPYAPEESAAAMERDRYVIESGDSVSNEVAFTDPVTGINRWILSEKSPLRDESGKTIGIICTTNDVTSLRDAARIEREQKEAALATEAMKSRFLASVSHDLRQPLQVMFMVASVLNKHIMPDGVKLMERMNVALRIQKNMLDSLLDISVLDAGLTNPVLSEFPLSEVLGQLSSDFSVDVKRKNLIFVDSVSRENVYLKSDRALFTRILSNIVGNAVRFTQNGLIELVGRQDDDHYTIAVRDTGIGIEPEQIKLIWNEFHQVGNRNRDREQGLGLGLTVVRKIASILDLKVDVKSTFGQGSVFTIAVPMVGEPAIVMSETPLSGENGFVVLIDDDPLVRETINLVLCDLGYRVVAAPSTSQALALLKDETKTPEMLVVDFRLQGETGIDSARILRQRFNATVPSVLLTGDLAHSVQTLALENTMRLLHKPISISELASVLEANKSPISTVII